jgi:hypothetical protein
MRQQKITLGEMRDMGMRAPARHFGLDPIARQAQEKRPPVTPNGSFFDCQFPGSARDGPVVAVPALRARSSGISTGLLLMWGYVA